MVSDRRGAVLSALRGFGRAVAIEEIAAQLDLHPNTVRFHLRRLVADGLAEQATDSRGGRGRPRQLFRPVTHRDSRNYLLLSRMLAHATAESGDVALAERTGDAWGQALLAETGARPSKRAKAGDAATVAGHLREILDSIGFAPEVAVADDGLHVDLRHCPFLEVAREQPGLVCGMHRALIQGVLNGLDSGLQVTELRAFVEPGRCTASIAR